jgi:hypothetical protein
MTRLLEKAIEKIKQLPATQQNRFANMLLDEMSWQQKFESTQSQLDKLGTQVLLEIKKGKFRKADC